MLFLASWNAKLPAKSNGFMQGSFRYIVGLTSFTGSFDIIILMFLLFLVLRASLINSDQNPFMLSGSIRSQAKSDL